MDKLEQDMTQAAKDYIGSGYIPEYYREAASDFILIARAAIEEAYLRGKKDGQRSKPEMEPKVEDVWDRHLFIFPKQQ